MPTDDQIPVLAAVIRRDSRYLICQRPRHKRHGGLWEFPGGKREAGEDHAAAAAREMAEELGVTVTGTGPLRFSRDDPGSRFVIEFVDVAVVGEPVCHEHEALAWVTLGEAAGYDLAPSDRAFVDFLLTQSGEAGPA